MFPFQFIYICNKLVRKLYVLSNSDYKIREHVTKIQVKLARVE